MNKLSAGKASILVLTAVFMVAALLFGRSITPVSATQPEPFITICHHTPGQDGEQTVTHTYMNEQAYLGHLGTPHSTETYDTAGECEDPDEELVYGCTDEEAINYESEANTDDGSCVYKTPVCADDSYENYGGEDGVFDQETEVANDELCSNEPTVDVCPNLQGDQETLPEGYDYDEQRNCVQIQTSPTPEPTPLSCSGDTHLDASGQNCVSYNFGGPGSSGGTGGQVLGASTMAQTGSFLENIYAAVMAFGAALTAKGLKSFKKVIKKA